MASTSAPPTSTTVRFKLILFAICLSVFLATLDFTSVGTIVPAIVHDLPGPSFAWIGAAYAISSAAFVPMAGLLNNIYGRQPVLLVGIFLFMLGSALCGGAQTLNMLIAARAIQGAGAGNIWSGSSIVLSDLVPLSERAKYSALLSLTWSIASVLGPVLGGLLASTNAWRWLFFVNLPLGAIAGILVILCLNTRIPSGTFIEKARKVDVIGNLIIIGSTTSLILALTWGGVAYSWTSTHVLVPLIAGIIGLIGCAAYEAYIPAYPTMPPHLFKNPTTLLGFLGSFLSFMFTINVVYYLPVFFQGVWMTSATGSGALLMPVATLIGDLALGLLASGAVVQRTGNYLILTYCGWIIVAVGLGLLTLLRPTSSTMALIGLTVVVGLGIGILFLVNTFLILAPLDPVDNAHAMALMAYFRALGQAVGVTIGLTVLQNSLKSHLSPDIVASLPRGVEMSYSLIPAIRDLPEPLQSEARHAFSLSLANIWFMMIPIALVGLIASFFAKSYVLHTSTDEKWALGDRAP
ncbi:MFS general substrate transporter [Clavulina sp. PMI_390]|nr:MFS general substrate transporter [Clavulina sp. PMI_390]